MRIESGQFRTLFVGFDVPEAVLDIKCAEDFGTAEVWQGILNGGLWVMTAFQDFI